MPIISVIVPVYNVEPYLNRCVDSILEQTFTDFELILVDDGSPDHCPMVCDEYSQKDKRVHVIHQKNGGLSAARNAGIDWVFANSDSQWISFVDSDDWVHPEYLERLLNAAVENDVAVSICGYAETEGENPVINTVEFIPKIWTPENFFVEHNVNAVVAWGKIYQKKCFKKIRYPKGKIHEDEFITHQILFEFEKIAVIEAPLYAYYKNQSGITQAPWKPARLSAVEAVEGQIEYMRQHGYPAVFRYAVRKYVMSITVHIFELEKCDPDLQKKYLPRLRRKLRRTLLKYKEIVPFSENTWLYENAYPRFMWLYWVVKAQIQKIKKKSL